MVQLDPVIDLHTFSIAARAAELLWKDRERDIRQVHGVDAERSFCHTGVGCVPWCGHEEGGDFTEPRMYHNLRVDDHADPVAELRRVWEVVVEHTRRIELEHGPAAVRLFGRVKH
jgi:uncharacterized Ntn-hydrolase superfamily protein